MSEHFVFPPPSTTHDLEVIARGHARAAVVVALAELAHAAGNEEALLMSLARALDSEAP
jgi:hypothetical protein